MHTGAIALHGSYFTRAARAGLTHGRQLCRLHDLPVAPLEVCGAQKQQRQSGMRGMALT